MHYLCIFNLQYLPDSLLRNLYEGLTVAVMMRGKTTQNNTPLYFLRKLTIKSIISPYMDQARQHFWFLRFIWLSLYLSFFFLLQGSLQEHHKENRKRARTVLKRISYI